MLKDIEKLFKNAVLVRDMDCDSIYNSYFIFSNEAPEHIEEIVRQARENWERDGSDFLFHCVEKALSDAKIEYFSYL